MDVFGEEAGTYSIWLLNIYSYTIYWVFGVALIFMQLYEKPKDFKKFKIQQNKNELKDIKKLYNVISALKDSEWSTKI